MTATPTTSPAASSPATGTTDTPRTADPTATTGEGGDASTRRRHRPSGPGRRGEPAGIVSRGVAYALDAMVIVLLLSLLSFAIESLALLLTAQDADVNLPSGFGTTLLTISVVAVVYYTLGWWLFGRTVGKLVLGVRVVGANGRRPTFFQSLLRALAYWVSAIFMLGFAWIGLTPRRRGWHDHIARTWVVYDWAAHRRQAYDDDPLPPRA